GAGTDARNFEIDTIPQKVTARRMIEMVASINQQNFAGVQMVTCWTCHRQQERPATSIALDHLYDAPYVEDPDIAFNGVGKLTADQILDKYIQAVGGTQRLAGLTSFVATGVSDGYGGFGGEGQVTIYAKSPNQRTTIIGFKDHPERGDSIWTINGTRGWVKTPRGFLPQYELIGEELAGEKLEAMMAFPGQIKQVLTNWRVGLDRPIGDKDYVIVQGNGPRGPYRDELATLYFDKTTGLLRRLIRYGTSPVGRVPVQIDYTDYRDVNGIKFPFEIKFSWLDGKYTALIKDIKTNVTIDAAKFAEPKGN
ncbi:MAG TPA: photosynthetic reaction center cytochrome c subunit family protein, partial [Terriglobia bacterium]|nr:photosynthetic reaction center cytochrome c subunit family protein [Terriglobia bacterium]